MRVMEATRAGCAQQQLVIQGLEPKPKTFQREKSLLLVWR